MFSLASLVALSSALLLPLCLSAGIDFAPLVHGAIVSNNTNPFQVVASHDDTSYLSAVNGSFIWSQNGCQSNCPFYTNGTVFFIDGKGNTYLDVGVPGGQQVYIEGATGRLKYVAPGNAGLIPEGSITGYFDRATGPYGVANHWGLRAGRYRNPAFDIGEWAACAQPGQYNKSVYDQGRFYGGRAFAYIPAFEEYDPPCANNPYISFGYTVPYTGTQPAVYSYP